MTKTEFDEELQHLLAEWDKTFTVWKKANKAYFALASRERSADIAGRMAQLEEEFQALNECKVHADAETASLLALKKLLTERTQAQRTDLEPTPNCHVQPH